MKTTLLKRVAEMERKPLPNCHGGAGALDWTTVLSQHDNPGQVLRFLHDDVLPPGASIGVHTHQHEEHYYFLAGRGKMSLDGQVFEVKAGDIASVYAGGAHGLLNDSDRDLRLIVIGL
jgi:uncharacterized RmlC-like cupin family protein